ncbi:hypothetical protein AOL_s00080g95 [Orbilia oligospora ATCC 24927]|uniref:Extracellular membrane protein CFEM domain-containing protein n=1 Tax=Arthrobotrys oligospora (strain ATCC 24927 / CBS 115.81 / DSM 1491) TaxID=756982 RepID=G1XE60_ARTOA|nr:hypothetical protein AOL_s00080g95 [Orbilia oligospora ATCC 24927]EGX48466.1 hypothetical protein AOL_s00080g95 [Orbilia oligospora ATCC 24927]
MRHLISLSLLLSPLLTTAQTLPPYKCLYEGSVPGCVQFGVIAATDCARLAPTYPRTTNARFLACVCSNNRAWVQFAGTLLSCIGSECPDITRQKLTDDITALCDGQSGGGVGTSSRLSATTTVTVDVSTSEPTRGTATEETSTEATSTDQLFTAGPIIPGGTPTRLSTEETSTEATSTDQPATIIPIIPGYSTGDYTEVPVTSVQEPAIYSTLTTTTELSSTTSGLFSVDPIFSSGTTSVINSTSVVGEPTSRTTGGPPSVSTSATAGAMMITGPGGVWTVVGGAVLLIAGMALEF